MDERTPAGVIGSRGEFQVALCGLFAEAAQRASAQLYLCDADFADWPLGQRDVVDSLARWAARGRRLTVLAASFDELARRHPRWVQWRRQWAHVVDCRSNPELEAAQYPSVALLSGVCCLRLIDRRSMRATLSYHAADSGACREELDAVLQRSQEASPVTTLGI